MGSKQQHLIQGFWSFLCHLQAVNLSYHISSLTLSFFLCEMGCLSCFFTCNNLPLELFNKDKGPAYFWQRGFLFQRTPSHMQKNGISWATSRSLFQLGQGSRLHSAMVSVIFLHLASTFLPVQRGAWVRPWLESHAAHTSATHLGEVPSLLCVCTGQADLGHHEPHWQPGSSLVSLSNLQ